MYNRVYHIFRSKILSLTVPKKFVGVPSIFQKLSGIEKLHNFSSKMFCLSVPKSSWASLQGFWKFGISIKYMHKSGYNFFLSKIFCFTLPKIFVTESYCSCENFSFRKVSTDEKGGMIFFRRETLALQSRKISWASRQYFRKTAVSEIFMYNRGYHVFLSKIFCLTVPKKFVGIPSIFQKLSGIEKLHEFSSKSFCLTVPKKFVGIPLRFQKVWDID